MRTYVRVLMAVSPFVEVLGQMHGEATTFRRVGLADEDDRHTRGIAAPANLEESYEIREVLRDDDPVLDHGEFENIVIAGAGQFRIMG